MKTNFKTLKDLHEYYAVHNNCRLKEIATQPVYEITPPSSGILFIGEAPGRHEDLQGRPFVGSAGKFLDELLQSIGYTREEVYVSNIVKYRPPSNRDPQDDEKDACRVWLNAELIFVKPKVIVTLGRHALTRFVPGANITASHGQSFKHPTGIPIFAMYHPAAALYNPNLKEDMKKDFKALKKFLSTLPKKTINIFKKKEAIDEILKL
ncbi:MAG TPA: uracil-DNA glycosylase [Candidatus Dojkabacteria bacterium]|nr:uracil-DNA glycosylase [Candidatus Dojkabacteria bacterium]